MNNFVLVSATQKFSWSYISPEWMLCQYAGTLRYDEVAHFIKTAEPGHFIPIDENHLLFRVTQESNGKLPR